MCLLLHKLKFSHIRTFECLSQPFISQNRTYAPVSYSDDEDIEEVKDEHKSKLVME